MFQIVQKINEQTKLYEGLKVPVKIIVDTETKQFEVEVGSPPTSALLLTAAKIPKGSGTAGTETVGNVTLKQIVEIAKSKLEQLSSNTLKAAVKTVIGTCVSIGLTVNEKSPKEVIAELNEGKHQEIIT